MANLPDGMIIEFVETENGKKIETIQQELVYCWHCDRCKHNQIRFEEECVDIEYYCTMLDAKVNSKFGCINGMKKSV